MLDLFLETTATVFWGLALCLGVVLVVSLVLGILSQARYQQKRRKWANDIGGTP